MKQNDGKNLTSVISQASFHASSSCAIDTLLQKSSIKPAAEMTRSSMKGKRPRSYGWLDTAEETSNAAANKESRENIF